MTELGESEAGGEAHDTRCSPREIGPAILMQRQIRLSLSVGCEERDEVTYRA